MKYFLPQSKKIYFASDLHLGRPPDELNRNCELNFVQWLNNTVKNDAAVLFLLGDIFDFWFEYRHAVPCGFVRLLGKLAELTDSGISIHIFTGNHDQWMCGYLSREMNINVHSKPAEFEFNGKLFLVGHGHDVSADRFIERVLNFAYRNCLFRRLYAALHPRWGIALGKNWSNRHHRSHPQVSPFDGLEKEAIYQHARKTLYSKYYDFFIFGHRHLAMDIHLSGNSRYINIGEWRRIQTYAVFDGKDVSLQSAK